MSAQGIGRTLAAMVNITSASKGVLVIREPPHTIESSVPTLNAGVGGGLGHSSVPIQRILGRWVRGFWTEESSTEGECSAEWACQGEKYHVRWTLNDGEIDDVHISTH